MRNRNHARRRAASIVARTFLAVGLLTLPTVVRAEVLRVFTTTPDLGSLVRLVGGSHVDVSVMVKPTEDPHFSEAKPSFIKLLSEADAYVQVGLDLEIGYAPLLLQNARNARVLLGAPGFIDTSVAIAPLEVPSTTIDRSMGDVHPYGSPHYLVDPLRGVKAAKLIAERLGALHPEWAADFTAGYETLRRRIGEALVGAPLAAKYDAEKLAMLYQRGKLAGFLATQGDTGKLAGWLGQMQPYFGAQVVDDHRMWGYFAETFGIQVFDHMEPIPGVPPTTKHLAELVERMKASNVRVVITAPYYDPRHAQFLSQATGALVVPLAHQVGSRPGTDDYVAMVDYNVRSLADGLRRATERK